LGKKLQENETWQHVDDVGRDGEPKKVKPPEKKWRGCVASRMGGKKPSEGRVKKAQTKKLGAKRAGGVKKWGKNKELCFTGTG